MLSYIIYVLMFTVYCEKAAEDAPESKEGDKVANAAAKVCESIYKVELSEVDKQTREIHPDETIVATEVKNNNLVPFSSIIWFMKPGSSEVLRSLPENVKKTYKSVVEYIANTPESSQMVFTFVKPVLANMVGDGGKKPEEEAEGEEEPAEEETAEPEPAPAALKSTPKK